MTEPDRGQIAGPRILPTTAISLVVLALVVNEVFSMAPVQPGSAGSMCNGVCGCGACPPTFYGVAVIAGLTLVAAWLLGGPRWPPEDGEES